MLVIEPLLTPHKRTPDPQRTDIDHRSRAGEVGVRRAEEIVGVSHRGVCRDLTPNKLGLQVPRRTPEHHRHPHECVRVIVDDGLPRDGEDAAPGFDLVGLFAFADRAARELAVLVDFLQLRSIAQLQAVDGLEVRNRGDPDDGRPRRRQLIVLPAQSLVECVAEDAGEVARWCACPPGPATPSRRRPLACGRDPRR